MTLRKPLTLILTTLLLTAVLCGCGRKGDLTRPGSSVAAPPAVSGLLQRA